MMDEKEALQRIKELRDAINDTPDPASKKWINAVLFRLDQASDILEFPSSNDHRIEVA